jgi:hypothetical protein
LIQKVWYKRLSGLSRVGDIIEDPDVPAANFAFKGYGAAKGIQTYNLQPILAPVNGFADVPLKNKNS